MKDDAPPLLIYPEGGTTNGTGVIKFSKGAFDSLLPVKPVCMKYWSLRGQVAHGDCTSILWYFVYFMNNLLCTATLYELPVFEPNEYFWKNHWNPDKE